MHYVAPWWLPGGNLQTIWPALYARRGQGPRPQYRRERWVTPDRDFVDVDWLAEPAPATTQASRPLQVLFHGLEGSSRSHYAEAFADFARERGMAFAVPHFRGCSGELNRAPRAYHSGDHEEIGWMLGRLREQHRGPIVAVGVSLGGNALLRWAAEAGDSAGGSVGAVAAVWRPAAGRSAAASTGWSTPRCSCAP
jgi:predicted alpha/beta-fold hydrolase